MNGIRIAKVGQHIGKNADTKPENGNNFNTETGSMKSYYVSICMAASFILFVCVFVCSTGSSCM